MTETLTNEMRVFLEQLDAGAKPVCVMDRSEDRARQKCRKAGLAAYGGWDGDQRLSNQWRITEAGRLALNRSGEQP